MRTVAEKFSAGTARGERGGPARGHRLSRALARSARRGDRRSRICRDNRGDRRRVAAALAAGNKVLLAGNGGSAADAQHLAGECCRGFYYDRPPAAAIALTIDTSVLTAIGNDYGYDRLFERQVQGLGRPGDVLIAISTSGRSPNILRALQAARQTASSRSASPGGRRRHVAAVRSVPARAVGLDAADPAAPHHRRAHRLRPGRSAAVPARGGGVNAPAAKCF